MRTNWLNDLKVYWNSFFNLVNLIEMGVNLEKEFLKVESSFEWGEIMDI